MQTLCTLSSVEEKADNTDYMMSAIFFPAGFRRLPSSHGAQLFSQPEKEVVINELVLVHTKGGSPTHFENNTIYKYK